MEVYKAVFNKLTDKGIYSISVVENPAMESEFIALSKQNTIELAEVDAKEFTDNLLNIKNKIELSTGKRFNSVLANLYRDGQDSVAYHADNEAILGTNPAIASYSLGATRRFLLRHNQAQLETLKINLQHNSLLIMQDELQHHWQHAISKTKRPIGQRINLTFRWMNRLEQ